jgi:hypothetical protein
MKERSDLARNTGFLPDLIVRMPMSKNSMRNHEEKVLCRTPTPGKQGTRILKWKYDAIRSAILDVLPTEGEGLPFMELPEHVGQLVAENIRSKIGSIGWYTTCVKLDLEVKGEIKRVARSHPQRLLRMI